MAPIIPPAIAPPFELFVALVLPTLSFLAESEDFVSIDDVVLTMIELAEVKVGGGLGVLKLVNEAELEVVEETREVVDEETLVLLWEVLNESEDIDAEVAAGTVSILTCMKSKKYEAEARTCVISKVC